MPQPSHICVIANHMIATSEVITIATNYYNKFKLLFYDLLLFFFCGWQAPLEILGQLVGRWLCYYPGFVCWWLCYHPGSFCWRLRWYYWWDRPRFIGYDHLRRRHRRLRFIRRFFLWRFIGHLLLSLLSLFNTTWYRFNGFLYRSLQWASISAKGPFWCLDRSVHLFIKKIIGHLYSLPFLCHFWWFGKYAIDVIAQKGPGLNEN